MRGKDKKTPKKTKAERRRGVLAPYSRHVRIVTALVLAVVSASLAFTQLGFFGLGLSGEPVGYAIVELLPVALAALLLGTLPGMCMGLFAGAMLLAHAVLMPLDFYEYTFVTPLTSVVMLGVAGLLLGALFSFVLRNDPPLIRASIYIAIVCIIVSLLYSTGFVVNVVLTILVNIASEAASGASEAQVQAASQSGLMALALRMGDVGLQAWVDAFLMAVSCIVANVVAVKARQRAGSWGLRSTFALRLSIVVFVAFMITSAAAFASFTLGEASEASESMEGELSYLCNQIGHADQRGDALINLLDDAGMTDEVLTNAKTKDIVRAFSIDTLLDGYSREKDGTVLVLVPTEESEEGLEGSKNAQDSEGSSGDAGGKSAEGAESSESAENSEGSNSAGSAESNTSSTSSTSSEGSNQLFERDYNVVLSDDDRFKDGEKVSDSAGDEVVTAITLSEATEDMQRAVYDENAKQSFDTMLDAGEQGIRSQIVYVCAREAQYYTVAIMYPASKVFAERPTIMGWTALSAFVLLATVFVMVFLLLDRVVVQRIDETNGVLARITAGDLNAEVDVRDTREFASLSQGVNETVGALKGWIAEAENRMDAELATAKAIQESALPSTFPPFPDIPRFDIFASMNAAREVGGDFYDFFLIGEECTDKEGRLGFIMADVSGKGGPAALFMMKSMTQLRDYLQAGVEVGEAVENANRQLCAGNEEGMFVTAWVGVLDYATGHVDFVNAGHNPPLIWQKGSGWRWMTEKSGLPLGLFDGMPYETHSVDCAVGDQFLLYTDGVTEAMNVDGELFGEARLEALVNEHPELHPRMLLETLRYAVAAWAKGAEQSDDITILALEYGVPPEITSTLTVPASAAELPRVNEFIHAELDRRLCPKRVQNHLDIAVEELFVNVCHYAYPDATPEDPGIVRIQRTYSAEPPSIVVGIIDDGIPYNPLEKPDAVTPDDIADVPIGGLGILMAKKSVDDIAYERSNDSNIVTIEKRW